MDKPLKKQSSCHWIEAPWRSRDVTIMCRILKGIIRRNCFLIWSFKHVDTTYLILCYYDTVSSITRLVAFKAMTRPHGLDMGCLFNRHPISHSWRRDMRWFCEFEMWYRFRFSLYYTAWYTYAQHLLFVVSNRGITLLLTLRNYQKRVKWYERFI